MSNLIHVQRITKLTTSTILRTMPHARRQARPISSSSSSAISPIQPRNSSASASTPPQSLPLLAATSPAIRGSERKHQRQHALTILDPTKQSSGTTYTSATGLPATEAVDFRDGILCWSCWNLGVALGGFLTVLFWDREDAAGGSAAGRGDSDARKKCWMLPKDYYKFYPYH